MAMSAWTCPLWQCNSGAAGRRDSRRNDGDGDSASSRRFRHRCLFGRRALHIAGVPAVAREPAQASRACVLTVATSSRRSGGCAVSHMTQSHFPVRQTSKLHATTSILTHRFACMFTPILHMRTRVPAVTGGGEVVSRRAVIASHGLG
jgi:hypothetical protein